MANNSIRYILVDDVNGMTTLAGGCWHVKIGKTSNDYGYAEATRYAPNTVYKLTNSLYGGTWSGFEWENPPMELNKEYRTTERYAGKAVYVKLIDCGFMPNNSVKNVDCGIDAQNIVSYKLIVNNAPNHLTGDTPFLDGASFATILRCVISYTNINIYAIANMSAYTGICQIKYTKN